MWVIHKRTERKNGIFTIIHLLWKQLTFSVIQLDIKLVHKFITHCLIHYSNYCSNCKHSQGLSWFIFSGVTPRLLKTELSQEPPCQCSIFVPQKLATSECRCHCSLLFHHELWCLFCSVGPTSVTVHSPSQIWSQTRRNTAHKHSYYRSF